MGCHALLQRIFLAQGSNWGLLHCRQILNHLSHQVPKFGEDEQEELVGQQTEKTFQGIWSDRRLPRAGKIPGYRPKLQEPSVGLADTSLPLSCGYAHTHAHTHTWPEAIPKLPISPRTHLHPTCLWLEPTERAFFRDGQAHSWHKPVISLEILPSSADKINK